MRLCASVGYDALAIDQLTREAGVAKGTFYYHFPTKADMLIALVSRFVDELFVDLEATARTLTGTGQERFRTLLVEASSWKSDRLADALLFIPLLYKPENLELRHRLYESWIARTRTMFAPFVELGAADGSLDLPGHADPEIVTELVMALWLDGSTGFFDRALSSGSPDAFAAIVGSGAEALSAVVERVLGAAPGSFTTPVQPDMLAAMYAPFLAALHGEASPSTPGAPPEYAARRPPATEGALDVHR